MLEWKQHKSNILGADKSTRKNLNFTLGLKPSYHNSGSGNKTFSLVIYNMTCNIGRTTLVRK